MKSIPKKAKKRAGKKPNGDLLGQLVHFTGFSGDKIRKELHDILEKKQINIHDITLEQLRTVAASYVRQIMASILDRDQAPKNHSH